MSRTDRLSWPSTDIEKFMSKYDGPAHLYNSIFKLFQRFERKPYYFVHFHSNARGRVTPGQGLLVRTRVVNASALFLLPLSDCSLFYIFLARTLFWLFLSFSRAFHHTICLRRNQFYKRPFLLVRRREITDQEILANWRMMATELNSRCCRLMLFDSGI